MAVMLMSRQRLPPLATRMDPFLALSSASASATTSGLAGPSTSILAVPTLAPIPGSAAETPIAQSSAETSPGADSVKGDAAPRSGRDSVVVDEDEDSRSSSSGHPQHFFTPDETLPGSSRRASASGGSAMGHGHGLPVPGSYFPSLTSYTPRPPAPPYVNGSGGTPTTPVDRGHVTPLEIPPGTPDEPLFSAYPDVPASQASMTPGSSSSKGKGRMLFQQQPSSSSFKLQAPKSRRRPPTSSGPIPQPLHDGRQLQPSLHHQRRRRASTFSHAGPSSLADAQAVRRRASQHQQQQQQQRSSPNRSSGSTRRRRASAGSAVSPPPSWPSMPGEEARRQNALALPFSYKPPAEVDFTLQSVSSVAKGRPLASPVPPADTDPPGEDMTSVSPAISPRRSSLVAGLGGLALSDLPPEAIPNAVEAITADMTMPHDPPRRSSSLNLGARSSATDADGAGLVCRDSDAETTVSDSPSEVFSPAPSHNQLSSAKTSLSRSAKSGQEGGGTTTASEGALSAVKLQRSLEWEAKQGQQRHSAEKRKMILLELVETEVAYADDLKMLVQVYLPQLYALPGVSDRSAGLVARNARELLEFHAELAAQMVDVLRDEGIGYEPDADVDKVDRAADQVCNLLLQNSPSFTLYNEYCAGSIAAGTLVRQIASRTEYDSYERRCQIIGGSQAHKTLRHLLDDAEPSPEPTNRNRLQFKDYLIMPIQRVCRYPLLLSQLVDRTPGSEAAYAPQGSIVEQALGTMRLVAEGADEARRRRESEIVSATITQRMEIHPVITPSFLQSLGTCRLVGALDVLHHHPTIAPLVPPVRVKYLAAFLYRGYLVLAKVKRKVYEPRHYLPLEVFELIDITEGFLPHSIRLSLREHSFDLAASCEAEKAVWAEALVAARDESLVPPFELPASVSPFAATRTRRSSQVVLSQLPSPTSSDFGGAAAAAASSGATASSPMNKRHSVAVLPSDAASSPESPTTQLSFGDRDRTLLLKRATAAQRVMVDRGLADVFSEACAQARSKAQMHHELFTPAAAADSSAIASVPIRRNRSFLEPRPSSSITFSGEVRGAIMPVGSAIAAAASSADMDRRHRTYSGDPGAADQSDSEVNDFGVMRGRSYTQLPNSTHTSPAPSRKTSFSSLRARASSSNQSPVRLLPPFDRRKTTTPYSLAHASASASAGGGAGYGVYYRGRMPSRAKSTPVSPIMSPRAELPPQLHIDVGSRFSPPLPESPTARAHQPQQVYAAGRGFSNVPYKPESPTIPSATSSAWGTLKRSMSLARLRSSPVTDLSRLPTGDSPFLGTVPLAGGGDDCSPSSPVASTPSEHTRVPLSRRSSAFSIASSLGLTDKLPSGQVSPDGDAAAAAAAAQGQGRPGGTLRRKRSVRILERLSRLTPM